jgi:hypothetical protein
MGHPGFDHLAAIIDQNRVFEALQVISFDRSQ